LVQYQGGDVLSQILAGEMFFHLDPLLPKKTKAGEMPAFAERLFYLSPVT
jgi:hypothetical protein